MFDDSRRILLHTLKPFEDSDYDHLLEAFRAKNPDEFDRWSNVEKVSFANRCGLAAYPDQDLMRFVRDFISGMSVDELGGLGSSVAFRALRGRVLREIIDQEPYLNPAPGKILLTKPRTCSGEELDRVLCQFKDDHPDTWRRWIEVETHGDFSDLDNSPMEPISFIFMAFLREHCWVQCNSAILHVIGDVRKRLWVTVRRSRSS